MNGTKLVPGGADGPVAEQTAKPISEQAALALSGKVEKPKGFTAFNPADLRAVGSVEVAPVHTEACGKCKFSYSIGLKVPLECRRGPPSVQSFPDGRGGTVVITEFPRVQRHHWCGEFVAKVAIS